MKPIRRFLIADAIEQKYGSNLTTMECSKRKLYLLDKELVTGDSTRQALKDLTHDQQRTAVLGIQAFFVSVTSYLQQKLPLSNEFLCQLGCLNPSKKGKKSTVESIQNIAKVLQPEVSTTEVVDEWKLFQVDNSLPYYNPSERIEMFWNAVFKLHSVDGSMRYKVLPSLIKSALVLAQTNAESEQSLSVNARIVTQERASLGEKTMIGLHIVKEAVKFFDPVSNRPEMISLTEDLKKSVRSAHSACKAHLEEEKEMAERKKEEAKRRKKCQKRLKRKKKD